MSDHELSPEDEVTAKLIALHMNTAALEVTPPTSHALIGIYANAVMCGAYMASIVTVDPTIAVEELLLIFNRAAIKNYESVLAKMRGASH